MAKFTAFLALFSAAAAHLLERDIFSSLGPQLSPGAAIYDPSSPQWANESVRWSTYSAPTWVNVVVPATQDDIAATIKYATANNITFMAQGGGHGYSATLNLISNAIMINMQNFDYAIVDTPSTIRMGGGTHYGTLIPALYDAGAELPVGVSPCVGATGATIGGGVGRLNGLHGLMIDAVTSFRVVLASGDIVNVSSTSYPDLFYGMRGAGQLYGVIVETIYNTYPSTNNGDMYNVDMVFSGSQLESTLSVINDIMPNHPGELGLILLFTKASPPIINLNFVWAGQRSTGLKYSQMFNDTNPVSFSESMITWDQLPFKSNGGAFASVACDIGSKQNNYAINMKTFDLTTMRSVFDQFSDFITAYPDVTTPWLIEIFGQEAENAIPADRTAYPNRGYDNIRAIFAATYTDDSSADAADQYLKTVRTALNETSGYGELHIYQNYAHGDEPLEALYGYNDCRLQKLQCLKAKYDPTDVFKGYHDIPLPADGTCKE